MQGVEWGLLWMTLEDRQVNVKRKVGKTIVAKIVMGKANMYIINYICTTSWVRRDKDKILQGFGVVGARNT